VFGLFQENRGASGFVNFRYFYVYQHEIPGRYAVQREEGDRQRDIGICRCGSGHVDSNGHADKSGKQQRTGRGDVIGINTQNPVDTPQHYKVAESRDTIRYVNVLKNSRASLKVDSDQTPE
jgi:hypothetical protein